MAGAGSHSAAGCEDGTNGLAEGAPSVDANCDGWHTSDAATGGVATAAAVGRSGGVSGHTCGAAGDAESAAGTAGLSANSPATLACPPLEPAASKPRSRSSRWPINDSCCPQPW
mmetsp:Transcript_62831/g.161731  ORF Transcript_62831/g.161731 Transcript_62831/m.161731 type:complete len:114 (-) Transcript_62831:306-647(-)